MVNGIWEYSQELKQIVKDTSVSLNVYLEILYGTCNIRFPIAIKYTHLTNINITKSTKIFSNSKKYSSIVRKESFKVLRPDTFDAC